MGMRRVPVPDWGTESNTWSDSAEAEALFRGRWAEVLAIVDREVNAFVCDPTFMSDGGGFPDRRKLTGEYHLGQTTFRQRQHPAQIWHEVEVRASCPEKPWIEDQTYFGYLGLDICLAVSADDSTGEIEVVYVESRAE
ncbi:MAG: hypothetical protein HYY84_04255 [Deltaproteobacteria bacterium]|nr:hypothetical protein [Deltaproteobacteria bacterium]